jgi:predicted RNA-binding Zn-ribbon protein involved in translation (DUF1610 family)
MVAIPYCSKCNMKVDPTKTKCPRCGSPTRFKIVRQEQAKRLDGEGEPETGGYIRPPSA